MSGYRTTSTSSSRTRIKRTSSPRHSSLGRRLPIAARTRASTPPVAAWMRPDPRIWLPAAVRGHGCHARIRRTTADRTLTQRRPKPRQVPATGRRLTTWPFGCRHHPTCSGRAIVTLPTTRGDHGQLLASEWALCGLVAGHEQEGIFRSATPERPEEDDCSNC
jgi:hypothetical protein